MKTEYLVRNEEHITVATFDNLYNALEWAKDSSKELQCGYTVKHSDVTFYIVNGYLLSFTR